MEITLDRRQERTLIKGLFDMSVLPVLFSCLNLLLFSLGRNDWGLLFCKLRCYATIGVRIL